MIHVSQQFDSNDYSSAILDLFIDSDFDVIGIWLLSLFLRCIVMLSVLVSSDLMM